MVPDLKQNGKNEAGKHGRSFMSGLIDRAKRRFYDQARAVDSQYWWESFDKVCGRFIACYAELFDELAIRFPLDLIIPGTPDSRNFRSVGRLTSPASGARTSIRFQADKGSTLIISSAEFTPVAGALLDTKIVSALNEYDVPFAKTNPIDQVDISDPIRPTTAFTQNWLDRAILRDGDSLEYRVDNPSLAIQEWDYEIKGWTL